MSAKIELSLAPAKAKGLSEDERLDLGRLLLKAGYRVDMRNGERDVKTLPVLWCGAQAFY